MKIELLFVRHGESVRNLSCDEARRGSPEWLARQMVEEQEEAAWPLTEKGVRQAEASGAWIRERFDTNFQEAYVSPFLRARQTAERLGLGLTWQTDDRIREREWGEYCAEGFEPYTVDAYLRDLAECSRFTWRTPFPGAESIADVVPRAHAFLTDLLAKMNGGRAIVVSHGGTMRAVQLVLERLPIDQDERLPDYRMSNGCVIHYRLDVSDSDRSVWTGESRQAHPAFPHVPETAWAPIAGTGTLSL